jgi:dihydroneopterin aldolase
MILELHGLEVFGRHGLFADEQRQGQKFWFDVQLEVGERGADDRIEDGVDYTEVAAAIRELSDRKRFDLIEALAAATADLIYERFGVERVTVRVRKQPAGLGVEYSAATAERP